MYIATFCLPIHLLMGPCLGWFRLLATVNNVTTNTVVQISIESLLSIPLDLYLWTQIKKFTEASSKEQKLSFFFFFSGIAEELQLPKCMLYNSQVSHWGFGVGCIHGQGMQSAGCPTGVQAASSLTCGRGKIFGRCLLVRRWVSVFCNQAFIGNQSR